MRPPLILHVFAKQIGLQIWKDFSLASGSLILCRFNTISKLILRRFSYSLLRKSSNLALILALVIKVCHVIFLVFYSGPVRIKIVLFISSFAYFWREIYFIVRVDSFWGGGGGNDSKHNNYCIEIVYIPSLYSK